MSYHLKRKITLGVILILLAFYSGSPLEAGQPLQARVGDGVVLKVHLEGKTDAASRNYARQILQAARDAYREIVFIHGFNRAGYTFARPTPYFAYDSDKVIDIYIADVEAPFVLMRPEDNLAYKAEVFIPADYKKYQERYKINQPHLELKASLIHEFLHIVTFSYNRNLQSASHGKVSFTSTRWDWYTEGLARYFETLVGYREEFLSFGFRRRNGRIITVYKGGVNYFLQYPDKPLNERKYDFALFWQYLHQSYGMEKIEEISFEFRQIDPETCSNQQAMEIVARTLGIPLKNLLRNFSLYAYKVSSLPGEGEDELHPVSISELSSRQSSSYSICSFGFDFYEIDLNQDVQRIRVKSLDGRKGLNCLIRIHSAFNFSSMPVEADNTGRINIDATGFAQNSRMIIMFSNPTDRTIPYRICLD